MSNMRKPSHPTTAHGVIEIVEELPSNIPTGSQFGFFSCLGAITVAGTTANDPQDIAIKVISNTSQATSLTAGRFYSASLRLIKRENEATYTAYYTAKQPTDICASADGPDHLNQTTMCGLGIVVSRDDTSTDENGEPVLLTDVRHTDWDPQAKKLVSFDVTYSTPKKGTLSNAHGLFQLGRELFLTGLIVDWDNLKGTWIVQTITVSVTSGHQTLKTSPGLSQGADPSESPRKRKFVGYTALAQISSPLASTSTSSPAQTPQSSHITTHRTQENAVGDFVSSNEGNNGHSTDGRQISSPTSTNNLGEEISVNSSTARPEAPERTEIGDDMTYKNTYGKGRSKKDILNDARKQIGRK